MSSQVKVPDLNPTTWAPDLLSDLCTKQDRAVILCGMWALWMMRNKRRHGELSMPIHQAVIWARDTAFDLWQLNHKDEVVERAVKRWKKPLQGCLKINTDAAFYDESKQGATSCVMRDHSGAFYAAQAKWYDKRL